MSGLETQPSTPEAFKELGNAAKGSGDLEAAAVFYRRALALAPDFAPALYNLGMVLHEQVQLQEAEQLFRRCCELDATDIDSHIHLGVIRCKLGRNAEGAAAFRRVLEARPDDPVAWLWLGSAVREVAGQLDEAVRCLEKSVELDPRLVVAHYQLGLAYRKRGAAAQAAAAYRQALALEPAYADAMDGLGSLLQDEGRLEEAIEQHRAAIRAAPGVARSHSNLGCALLRLERVDEAVRELQRAVELQPDLASAWQNLGSAQTLRRDCGEAIRAYQTALALDPRDAMVRECLLHEMQNVCDWSRFDELCTLQRRDAVDPAQPVNPFSLLSIPSLPGEQLQCARNYGRQQAALMASEREKLAFRFDAAPRRKLRIGYLSADLHDHVTAYVMAEMFELHDRGRFDIAAYSYGPDDGSAMRARLRKAFDRFVEVGQLGFAEAAAAIHADKVDILVDLKGYTQHARTGITAMRPAPVQVSYMGYPGTMAAEFIDYFVVDRFVVPPAQAASYGEKLAYLPATYYVTDRKRVMAATPGRAEVGLPQDAFVFCCFNQTYKILPDVFARWMRLLAAVPRSVLWLLETNRWAQDNLRKEAAARGVDPARLVFAPRIAADRHLARIAAADLFLDTRPYNAHTTAADALWAGVPVLTWPGETFASRVAGSLLSALGVPELITDSAEGYETLALALAGDPARLGALRERIVRARDSAPLFDTAFFTRSLEAAYERMWETYAAGRPPADIRL